MYRAPPVSDTKKGFAPPFIGKAFFIHFYSIRRNFISASKDFIVNLVSSLMNIP